MPSGFLLGGASLACPRKSNGTVTLQSRVSASAENSGVTLRGNGHSGRLKTYNSTDEGQCHFKYSNKRNATYLNDEEYDEDLAQLDVLLHYVNNLSASLEFLKWEDKRISTDLVPTLLNMYDALYARLSESTCTSRDEEEETSHRNVFEEPKDKFEPFNGKLFIIEEDLSHRNGQDDSSSCDKCGLISNFKEERVTCSCPCSTNNNEAQSNSNLGTSRLKIEHDYDIPEFIEKPPDEEDILEETALKSKPLLHLTISKSAPVKENSPLPSAKRCLDLYRPLSSISSSSSSSSSNSLPQGALASYLASAESLEDIQVSEVEASRRKDKGLKARREKALRAGSDDSGVQCHIISLPVPPSIRPRYCDPNLNYVDRVVLEIVETEEIYVRNLNEVIEGYLQHWKFEPESSISPDVAESLFSNIEQIWQFNRGFLRELELCGTDSVLVAKCFVRNNSGFAIYTEYCTNYPRTVSVLTDLMREESSVKACRERQLSLGHTLPLGSYLLKPVQRVLKYHLLLGNIVKSFDKERPGYIHIWNAFSAMTGIAHHINDMKRKHEHAVRVQEIQSLLYGWQGEDLTTFGELAAEGAFRMFGVKALRHVFLFDKLLLITKKKDENILMYKAHILCSDLMLIESIPREPLSFHVIPFDNPKRQYTLECRNLEQKREWTLQLKRVILENYSATIPAHARQLVMELGQNSTKDSSLESRTGGRKAHCAPEYLEKRKDKRRASEVGLNSKLRIRRSSRARKEKKEQRSRSASRTGETDDDEDSKSNLLSPTSSFTGEKSKLRLPHMWRRRSEPGIQGRLSIPTSPGETESVRELSVNFEKEEDELDQSALTPNHTSLLDDKSSNVSQYSECNSLYEGDDNEEVAEENLEHIVSQLLQHQLQVQQNILNKQRRGLIRKKSVNATYETSDTENEDQSFEPLPPLPKSPPPMLSEAPTFSPEYIDLLFKQTEKEWSSGAASMASSTLSVNQRRSSLDSGPKSASVSRSGSDICTKMMNYDNLSNVWSQTKLKSMSRNDTIVTVRETEDSSLRRIQSFSNELMPKSRCDIKTICNESHTQTKEDRERPATIAIYDRPTVELNVTNRKTSIGQSESPINPNDKTRSTSLPYSKSSRDSIDDSVNNIHPEHKIYSKAYVNKGSIRKVLSRLKNPRGTPNKTVSEPSHSLSNIYANSEFDKPGIRKSANLVSSMARQYSKNLKERIKQIRTEDMDSSIKVKDFFPRNQCNNIGARLATTNEAVEYAVPNVHLKSDLRPDSVMSSSSIWTSSTSSSSSNKDTKAFVEDEVPCSIESDHSGDSFYEKSFEAIETFLEEEIFRDSAIYSEPEDSDGHHGLSPMASFRSTLSPKSSFLSDHNFSLSPRKLNLATSKSFDISLLTDSSETTLEKEDLQPSKKVPPPIAVKPDCSSLKKLRPIGNLVQQQLKNLEESQKLSSESSCKSDLNGIKSLNERREELKTFSDKFQAEKGTSRRMFNKKLNRRKCSLDSCLNVSPSMGFSYSPQFSSSNILNDLCENDEAMMSKGWVKHVIGKLQQ